LNWMEVNTMKTTKSDMMKDEQRFCEKNMELKSSDTGIATY
jgi:hypothetical protein